MQFLRLVVETAEPCSLIVHRSRTVLQEVYTDDVDVDFELRLRLEIFVSVLHDFILFIIADLILELLELFLKLLCSFALQHILKISWLMRNSF